MQTISEARESVLEALGNDYYLLAPGEYADPDRRDFLPPEIVNHVANAILLGFVGGLTVGLTEGGKAVGKRIGSWVSDRILKLLGKDAKTEERVTDSDVEKAIKELQDLSKGKDIKPEVVAETESAVATTLENRFGLTRKKALAVAQSASTSI